MAMWLDTNSGQVVYEDEGGYLVEEAFCLSFLLAMVGLPGPYMGLEFGVGWGGTAEARWWGVLQGSVLAWQ